METTEFKAAMAFVIVVCILIAFEVPARIIRWFQEGQDEIRKDRMVKNHTPEEPWELRYTTHPELKVSFWYGSVQRPVWVGVYETLNPFITGREFCYWDGAVWSQGAPTVREAEKNWASVRVVQNVAWRGVLDTEKLATSGRLTAIKISTKDNHDEQ